MENVPAESRELVEKFLKRVMEDYEGERADTLTPERAVAYITALSGALAWLVSELGDMEIQKSEELPEMKKKCNTVQEAKWMWDASEVGKMMTRYHALEKSCVIIIRACRNLRQLQTDEAYNKF